MTSFGIVYVTVPDEETGATIARALVDEGLAACVNLFPQGKSFYRWEGELHESTEHVLMIKTRESHAGALRTRVRELHPYELPAIAVLPIVDGDVEYLQWLDSQLGEFPRSPQNTETDTPD